jgi:D-xylose transport system permease protein
MEELKISFKKNIRQYIMLLALAGIWLVFAAACGPIFVSPSNLSNLFLQTVTVAIVACGMTLVIVTGNIDLSVGSVAGFAGAVAAVLQVRYGWGSAGALLAAIAAGLAVGAWHGFWVAYRKVPAFIVTLASMLAFRGLILGVTGGSTVAPLSGAFKAIGQQYLPDFLSASSSFNASALLIALAAIVIFVLTETRKRSERLKHGFAVTSTGLYLLRLTLISAAIAGLFGVLAFNQGVPYSLLLLMGVALLLNFTAENTVFGRRLYAIGGNPDAARLSGINISRNLMGLFVIFGGIVAAAGVVLTSRLNAATTSAGANMELDAIAACVIGGTSLLGGEGTIIGSIIGALIMSSLDNGMSLLNLDITYQYVIKGLILLSAVWLDISNRNK